MFLVSSSLVFLLDWEPFRILTTRFGKRIGGILPPFSLSSTARRGGRMPPILISQSISKNVQSGLITLGCCLTTGLLNAAEPDLKSVYPTSCKIGTNVEVTLIGSGLENGGAVFFSQEGLSAEHIEKNRFRVTVDTDARVGDVDFWLATAEGLAGPRRFSVTASPVTVEQESNDKRDEAQKVSVPAVIEARLDKAADSDWFEFDGQKDQVITIACHSNSLGGSVQPFITLLAPDGRERAHSPAHKLEPRFTYQCQASGTYRLLVHDRAYRKDDFSFYRLEVTAEGHAITPVQLAAGLVQPDDLFGSITAQSEQDHSRAAPQAIELPCRITGRLAERNDVDWMRFKTQKDQVVHIEAFGERLGQLMDLEVAIYNSDDKFLTTVSDLAAPKGVPSNLPLNSLDPATDWKAPADGEYLLALRDLYGSSIFGADRQFELIASTPQPNATVVAMPGISKPSRGVFVKRNDDAKLSLTVIRTGGLTGSVTIRPFEPIAGLAFKPCEIGDKELTKTLKVSAAKDAPIGFHSLRLVAEAKIDSDTQSLPVINATQIRTGVTRRIDDLIIYVSE